MQVYSYKDLVVWQRSINLVIDVYKYTKTLPEDEKYGLVSQMRRAAVSVPSNIAEGYTRQHTNEFIQFLGIADGSAAELDTQLIICNQLKLADNRLRLECQALLIEVQKLIPAVIKGLKKKNSLVSSP